MPLSNDHVALGEIFTAIIVHNDCSPGLYERMQKFDCSSNNVLQSAAFKQVCCQDMMTVHNRTNVLCYIAYSRLCCSFNNVMHSTSSQADAMVRYA